MSEDAVADRPAAVNPDNQVGDVDVKKPEDVTA